MAQRKRTVATQVANTAALISHDLAEIHAAIEDLEPLPFTMGTVLAGLRAAHFAIVATLEAIEGEPQ